MIKIRYILHNLLYTDFSNYNYPPLTEFSWFIVLNGDLLYRESLQRRHCIRIIFLWDGALNDSIPLIYIKIIKMSMSLISKPNHVDINIHLYMIWHLIRNSTTFFCLPFCSLMRGLPVYLKIHSTSTYYDIVVQCRTL